MGALRRMASERALRGDLDVYEALLLAIDIIDDVVNSAMGHRRQLVGIFDMFTTT
jgi:hypothetical protein